MRTRTQSLRRRLSGERISNVQRTYKEIPSPLLRLTIAGHSVWPPCRCSPRRGARRHGRDPARSGDERREARGATRVRVSVTFGGNRLRLTLRDDGAGLTRPRIATSTRAISGWPGCASARRASGRRWRCPEFRGAARRSGWTCRSRIRPWRRRYRRPSATAARHAFNPPRRSRSTSYRATTRPSARPPSLSKR
jgi:hypothetical protein